MVEWNLLLELDVLDGLDEVDNERCVGTVG